MYSFLIDLMTGFDSVASPLEYICGFLLFLVVVGAFFRLLYTLIKPR